MVINHSRVSNKGKSMMKIYNKCFVGVLVNSYRKVETIRRREAGDEG